MRVLGLTGSIGSGKSHVSSYLASLGARIVDGDRISHALTAPGGKALPAIRKAFGDAVFTADGTLNRRELGRLVFSSEDAKALRGYLGDVVSSEDDRRRLNGVIQPMILDEIHLEMCQAEADGADVCVLDMPLLFEEHLEVLCDSTWCVFLPEDLQIQRIMERDHCTRQEALSRIHSQMDAREKAARADVVIDTSGSFEETERLILPLYRNELKCSDKKGDAQHAGTSRQAPPF